MISGDMYKQAIRDRRFRKRWEVEKLIRMQEQFFCYYCGEKFGKKVRPVLHHVRMGKKIRKAMKKLRKIKNPEKRNRKRLEIQERFLEYYKSLEDTDLICVGCHAKIHGRFLRRKKGGKQRRLF